jgi:hypothetical protein
MPNLRCEYIELIKNTGRQSATHPWCRNSSSVHDMARFFRNTHKAAFSLPGKGLKKRGFQWQKEQ